MNPKKPVKPIKTFYNFIDRPHDWLVAVGVIILLVTLFIALRPGILRLEEDLPDYQVVVEGTPAA